MTLLPKLPLLPDVVKMGVTILRADADVTALTAGGAKGIRGQLGDDPQFPCLRVMRLFSSATMQRPHWLERVTIQIDGWGGNNRQAERMTQTARRSLMRAEGWMNDEGVITGVWDRGMRDLADESYEPPRERYILTMELSVRPLTQVEISELPIPEPEDESS